MTRIVAIISLLFLTSISLAQGNLSLNEGGTSQIDYFSSLPYENINGKIIVNVNINGKFYRFILDTGAPTSISSRLFNEINPNIISTIPITDANNKKDSLLVVRLNNIKLGDVDFLNIPTLVIKENPILDCFKVDGFLGSNLLRNSIIQFNNTKKELTITSDNKNLTLNSKSATNLILDNQSSPIISIFLGSKKKVKEQLLLDLGMNGFYDLSLSHFNFFKKNEAFQILGSANGSNSMSLFGTNNDFLQHLLFIPQIELNGNKILNVTTITTSDNNSKIGSKILEYGTVTIDYKNKKFYFEPYNQNDIDATEKRFPIDFIPENNKLYVSFIWDNDLLTKVSKGDQIIRIDDVNYEEVSMCNLITNSSIFKDKIKLKLTTKNQKGQIVETIIERK